MERVFRLLLPILILLEIALVWSGLLELSTAIAVVVAVELAILAVAIRQAVAVVRRYRSERRSGGDIWSALEQALAVVLPSKVARLLSLEPKLWFCLWLWLARRTRPDSNSFAYHKRSSVGTLLPVVFLTTPVELFLFELLIPWSWLRWILLIGGVYLLFWCAGLYASLVVLPHRLEPEGIRLRYGTLADAFVPYAQIASAEARRCRSPGRGDGLRVDSSTKAAHFAISGQTDVTLELATECLAYGMLGPTKPVSVVSLAADDPQQLVSELRQRLSSTPAVR